LRRERSATRSICLIVLLFSLRGRQQPTKLSARADLTADDQAARWTGVGEAGDVPELHAVAVVALALYLFGRLGREHAREEALRRIVVLERSAVVGRVLDRVLLDRV